MEFAQICFSVFGIALVASLGHCVGMCGGVVLAYSAAKFHANAPFFKQAALHLLYNFGRITTYAILGALLGFLGQKIFLDSTLKNAALLAINALLVMLAILLLLSPKTLAKFEPSIAKNGIFSRAFGYLLISKTPGSFFVLGMLNGVFPCGIVYYFLLTSAASGGALKGALVMFIFGAATLPTLFLFALFSSYFAHKKELFLKIAALLMLIFAAWQIAKILPQMLNF